jgi:hypothetical protein
MKRLFFCLAAAALLMVTISEGALAAGKQLTIGMVVKAP